MTVGQFRQFVEATGYQTDAEKSGAAFTWATNNIYDVKFPGSDGFPFVSPVDHFGSRGRNSFGLADMLGNVWEWCADFYQDGDGAHEAVNTVTTPRRVDRGSAAWRAAGAPSGPGTSPAAPSRPAGFEW